VSVQRRVVGVFSTVALYVPVTPSSPDAVPLAGSACGVTPLTYGLEFVAFDFPDSVRWLAISRDLQGRPTCKYHTLSVLSYAWQMALQRRTDVIKGSEYELQSLIYAKVMERAQVLCTEECKTVNRHRL
jgi:hypothetical protein